MDVYMDKVHGNEAEITEAMKMGLILEPVVRELFMDHHGDYESEMIGPYTIIQGEKEHEKFSPDDMFSGTALLEAKAPGLRQAHRWGDEDTDQVPPEYLVQVHWGLGITEREIAYLAALIGGQRYREYNFDPDSELFGNLREIVARFWRDHIQKQVPPPLDGSDATKAFLEAQFPDNIGSLPVATDGRVLGILDEARDLKRALDKAGERYEVLKNQIKGEIGENDGLLWPGGQITWKKPKDKENVDWKGAYGKLGEEFIAVYEHDASEFETRVSAEPEAEANAIVNEIKRDHTTTKTSTRRFLPKFKEFEDEQTETAIEVGGTPSLPQGEAAGA